MKFYFHISLFSALLLTYMTQGNGLKEFNNHVSVQESTTKILNQDTQESFFTRKALCVIASGVITVVGIVLWIIKKRNSKDNYVFTHQDDLNDDAIDFKATTD